MAPDALRFRRLQVRRMPGIRDGGFALDDLASGINIVFGPNASGKTTTARAIETLLWPGVAGRDASLVGRFDLGGAEWLIDLDAGRVRAQRDGRDVEAPALVPAESRDRYRLALPELLASTDEALANAVLRESAGGYDLAAAADALGFRAGASRSPREAGALLAARGRVEAAVAAQERLVAEERRLAELEPELHAAAGAARRVRLLELALEAAEAREREANAMLALAAYPSELARLRGDEADRLAELKARIDAARQTVDETTVRRDRAAAEREATGLPPDGLGAGFVRGLREELRRVDELEQQAAALEREVEALAGKRDSARQAVAGEIDEQRLASLPRVKYDALVNAVERAARLRADRAELAAQERWLQLGAELPDLDRLLRAAYRLQDWLRLAGDPDTTERLRLRNLALILAVLAAVAGLALAVVAHPIFAIIVVIALGLGHLAARPVATESPRNHVRDEYLRDGFPPPDEWSVEQVRTRLELLEARIADARLLHERAQRWGQLAERRARVEEEEAAVDEERLDALRDLGLPGDVDVNWLHLLVNRISAWQTARDEATASAAKLRAAREQVSAALRRLADRLEPLGPSVWLTPAGVAAAIEEIAEREQRFVRASDAFSQAEPALHQARAELERLRGERSALLEGAGLDEAAEPTLVDWCARHAEYHTAQGEARDASRAREQAEAKLRAHPDHSPRWEDMGAPALLEELEARRAEAERADSLREKVTEIRTRVEEARRRHDVEAALAAADAAEAALLEARERDVAAALGALLAEEVQKQTRDLHRPAVFHRAREELTRITRGHYQLDFDDGQPPAFRAIDTITGAGHPLAELSSGTRVQLLMAVRLAFVDTLEAGVALPLLFDETLGNADDRRAQAIMEATIELAAAGRQVFYFTAQADEVAKWLEVLRARGDVPHRVIDLGQRRSLGAGSELPPLSPPASPPVPIPPSADDSYLEYGRSLGVPPLDPHTDRVEAVHLWHLLDDPHRLHALLSHGIATWGALRTLAAHGGRDSALYEQAFERAAAAARALEIALPLARIGTGRPTGRAVLIESGAITDRFLDQVCDLCERYDGDAARILDALAAGEVPRFRNEAREQLRLFLEDVGCLDERDPLPPEQIRARVLGGVALELEDGRISLEQIDRMLQQLVEGREAREEVRGSATATATGHRPA